MTCLQMSLGWWNQNQRAQSPPSLPFQPAAAAQLYHCGSVLVHIYIECSECIFRTFVTR